MIVGSKDEIKRIYISGPITNVKNWKKNFLLAEKKILELDKTFAVVNPLKISERIEKDFAKYEKTPDYQDYMREDIKLLADCNAICMLPGWKRSKGARLEYRIAKILNLTIIELWSVNRNYELCKNIACCTEKK